MWHVGIQGLNSSQSPSVRVYYQREMSFCCLFKTLSQTRRSGSDVNNGEGNKNSAHLIVVTYFARYKFLIIIIIFKPLALFLSSFLSLIVHQKWTNGTELSF